MAIHKQKREVRTFEVRALHEGCGGEYESNGLTLTSNPPQYPHACSKCGHVENLTSCYPRLVQEPVIQEKD